MPIAKQHQVLDCMNSQTHEMHRTSGLKECELLLVVALQPEDAADQYCLDCCQHKTVGIIFRVAPVCQQVLPQDDLILHMQGLRVVRAK